MKPRRHPARHRPLLEITLAGMAALALTLLAFGPARHAEFVSDDTNCIVENEWVVGPLDPAGIFTNFSWWGQGRSDAPGYRPAATLSFALSRHWSGAAPAGFRVVNYLLHAVCTALLFGFGRALGLGVPAATVAALLFAVLPIHSEAIVWIVGRADLAAAASFLAAAWACLWYRRGGSAWSLLAAGGAVAIGILLKENAITVLAMPLVYFLTLGAAGVGREPTAAAPASDSPPVPAKGRSPKVSPPPAGSPPALAGFRRDGAALLALLAGAAIPVLLRMLAAAPPAAPDQGSLLDNPLSVVDVGTRLLGALAVLGRYLRLTVWPSALSVDYSWDALGIGPGFVASTDSFVALGFLAAAVGALRWAPGRRDILAVGLGLALVTYSIFSNTVFVLGTILGERLFYLPTAGLSLAAGALAETWMTGNSWRSSRGGIAVVALTGLAVLASIGVDRDRSRDWLTPISLFESATTAVPRSARAHMELATAYGNEGRVEDSLRHFARAREIKPDYFAAAYNQGNALAKARRFDEAAEAYEAALDTAPLFTRAWHNLAITQRLRGRNDKWVEALRGAAKSAPGSQSLANELGEALLATGQYEEAIGVYDALIATDPSLATPLFNRGVARHHLGGCAAAIDDYRLATKASQPPPQIFATTVGCLRDLGRPEEAEAVAQAAKVANRDMRR